MFRIQRIKEYAASERLQGFGRKAAALVRRNGGRIVYYGCVALVLAAVATAAERYRTEDSTAADALILPAVEMDFAMPQADAHTLALPEGASVISGYASLPQWNRLLGQWQVHTAVDYALPDGAVNSLSAGTVRTVGKSGIYGGFVEVEAGEYMLRYASVEPDVELHPGMELEAGDRIGTADGSMPGEAHLGAHMHLELMRNGEFLDFAKEAGKKLLQDN